MISDTVSEFVDIFLIIEKCGIKNHEANIFLQYLDGQLAIFYKLAKKENPCLKDKLQNLDTK